MINRIQERDQATADREARRRGRRAEGAGRIDVNGVYRLLAMFPLLALSFGSVFARQAGAQDVTLPANFISPNVPADIPGGAQNASLTQAAIFAWQEFIALNWPAVPQTGALNNRDQADQTKLFGQPGYTGPLAWQTYRGKVEIFPGQGNPPGYAQGPAQDYGYDALPQYVYMDTVQRCQGTNPIGPSPPWINLDENNEIGANQMYAGVAPKQPFPGQQFLFMAKANRAEYQYVVSNGWYAGTAPTQATAKYISTNQQSPPPGSAQYVSFPYGTIELKAAWRQLTTTEQQSGKFLVSPVRYYQAMQVGQAQKYCYVDATWGLAALHIIHKTPSAPYFIYATFGQASNILDAHGNLVEDANGRLIGNPDTLTTTPLEPNITVQNATQPPSGGPTPSSIEQMSPKMAYSTPGSRLSYVNTASYLLTPQGTVSVNKRIHLIPQEIIRVNRAVHAAISSYNASNNISSSPWMTYKLVNVQFQPYDKPAGITYTGGGPGSPDPSTYYQANIVVETDYNLQVFSGQFQPVLNMQNQPTVYGLITDWNNNGTPFKNTYYNTKGYNMGGCMGCHGNAQVDGTDFSFILLEGRVKEPEAGDVPPLKTVRQQKLLEFLHRSKRP
jgi:hypothetical protein